MTEALKKLDFDVLIGTNLNQIEMKQIIEKFGGKIKNVGVGLFYYAGHGMQVNGRNYLIPIDAKIKSENDVDIVTVRADEILANSPAPDEPYAGIVWTDDGYEILWSDGKER